LSDLALCHSDRSGGSWNRQSGTERVAPINALVRLHVAAAQGMGVTDRPCSFSGPYRRKIGRVPRQRKTFGFHRCSAGRPAVVSAVPLTLPAQPGRSASIGLDRLEVRRIDSEANGTGWNDHA